MFALQTDYKELSTMSRKFMSTTYVRIPTAQGDLLGWCTRPDDDGRAVIGLRTEGGHNRWEHHKPAGGWDGMPESVTLHQVAYRVHGFVAVGRDGTVTPRPSYPGDSPITRAEACSIDGGSTAAQRAAWALLTEAVTDFVQTEEGEALIRQGIEAQRNNRAREIETELEEVRARAEELELLLEQLDA